MANPSLSERLETEAAEQLPIGGVGRDLCTIRRSAPRRLFGELIV
jgi:hypothetical protein